MMVMPAYPQSANRQPDPEVGPFPRRTGCRNGAPVVIYNLLTNRKTDAGTCI